MHDVRSADLNNYTILIYSFVSQLILTILCEYPCDLNTYVIRNVGDPLMRLFDVQNGYGSLILRDNASRTIRTKRCTGNRQGKREDDLRWKNRTICDPFFQRPGRSIPKPTSQGRSHPRSTLAMGYLAFDLN